MFTVYDFLNGEVEESEMKFGWKVSTRNTLSCHSEIMISYTMLNFDWNSLDFVNGEIWNGFLNSKGYAKIKERLDNAMKKFGRTFFSAYSIYELTEMLKEYGIEVDVEKMVSAEIRRRSEELKEKTEIANG